MNAATASGMAGGCRHALEQVETLLEQGYTCVVDADLKSYFDTIPHDKLLDLVREKVSDRRVLSLIEQFLHQGVLEECSALRAKTKRTRSGNMHFIVSSLNQTLRGWFTYFRYSWPTVFVAEDQRLRTRLRTLPRKRRGRRGIAKGADHQRFGNDDIVPLGAFK